MCIFSIPVVTSTHRPHSHFYHRRSNPSNLTYLKPTSNCLSISAGLWNCQSAVKKADTISAHALSQSLHFLALTETWITPENSATVAALSAAYSFSHSPRPTSQRGGGTGLLISPKWSYTVTPLSHLSINSFEPHAVAVSLPTKLNIVVIYRPPGALGSFLDELDTLLSAFPDDGTPLVILGDFNLKPVTLQSASFRNFLSSFDISLSPSPPTQKAGKVLDLVFTRSCSTCNLTATPLPVSDHHFITLSIPLFLPTPHPPTYHHPTEPKISLT